MKPVLISGVGGSGTRAIAMVLHAAGYYLGNDVNDALDNLWFTLLLRRPEWRRHQLAKGARGRREIREYVSILIDALEAGGRPRVESIYRIAQAGADTTWKKYYSPKWAVKRARSLMDAPRVKRDRRGWGFKESNAILYLPYFARRVPELHYVHLVRHGGDMALSDNQFELDLWGNDLGASGLAPIRDSLLVWRRLNEFAVEAAERDFQERHLVVRYEDLCADPIATIGTLFRFLGVREVPDEYAEYVRPTSGLGRYKRLEPRLFSSLDREVLGRFGYEC